MEKYLELQQNIITTGNDKEGPGFIGKNRSLFSVDLSFDLNDGLPILTTNQIDLGDVLTLIIKALNNIDNYPLPTFESGYCHHGFHKFLGFNQMYNLNTRNIPTSHMDSIREEYRYKLPRTLTKEEFESKLPTMYLDIKVYQPTAEVFTEAALDITFYSTLLMIFAERVNMIPRFVHWSCGHAYITKQNFSAVKNQLNRKPFKLPKLVINGNVANIRDYTLNDFQLYGYESHTALVVNKELV
tara:strand:- start:856 stop:1581 length:726 start_codon:yes stop_codon:yes gene_type:complete